MKKYLAFIVLATLALLVFVLPKIVNPQENTPKDEYVCYIAEFKYCVAVFNSIVEVGLDGNLILNEYYFTNDQPKQTPSGLVLTNVYKHVPNQTKQLIDMMYERLKKNNETLYYPSMVTIFSGKKIEKITIPAKFKTEIKRIDQGKNK